MNKLLVQTLLSCSIAVWMSSSPSSAQTPASTTASNASMRRTSLQWTEMKGKRTQIFIDLHAKHVATFHGLGGDSDFQPTLMVQLAGDGSVSLLEYTGSGEDWKWTPVEAHIALTHPSPNVDHVEFDYTPLAASKNLTIIFRSLDDAWTPVASSKVLPWQPN